MSEYLHFRDLRRAGIPYSRNWLDELIRRGLFPPGRRLTPGGRRHWTQEEIREVKERMAAESQTAAREEVLTT
jgi:predicted DNA-binding transcriptional regulator AlpA